MNNYFKYGSLEDTPKYSCRRKENIQYPAYKLMFGLAIYDLLNIFVCGYWMGYFTIYGFHFCDKPTLIFWTGLYCGLFFIATCLTSVSLLFNRLLDVAECRGRDLLFKGKSIYLFIFVPFLVGLDFSTFETPVLFNPDYGTVIFHPLIPGNMDHVYNVANQIYLNIFVCTSLGTCSILIYVIQWRKEKIMGLKMGSYRKQVLRQAILVSLFVFTTTLIWTSLAFIPQGSFSIALMHIGHISWMLMHSTPAMIYLSFNKTIRNNVRRLVGIAQVSRVYHTNGSEVVAPSIP
ncbi:unnamed protein product, partial [Mesorhabditis spiculigera]